MSGDPSYTDGSKSADLAIGTLVAGRYEVVEELGRGGMSVVYRCEEQILQRQVAVKVFRVGNDEKDYVDRFQKEARAVSALSHPNIVKVFASGIDGKQPYIAMELLSGRTLEKVLDGGPLTATQFAAIFPPVLDAVAHAHANKILHRDLKPGNIMLPNFGDTVSGAVKILDFSLAKILGENADAAKTVGLAGTPYYMSPEQCRGVQSDERSDIYSLGAVMYETIVGARPFSGETAYQVMYAHMNEAPPKFGERGNSNQFSAEVKNLVSKCLSKKPEDRFSSVREMAESLAACSIEAGTAQGSPSKKSTSMIFISAAAVAIAVPLVVFFSATKNSVTPTTESIEPKSKREHKLKTSRERIDEAVALTNEGKYDEAIAKYHDVIKRCEETKNYNDLQAAYRDCGYCYLLMKRFDDGIKMYQKRLTLTEIAQPGSEVEAEFVSELAWAYHRAGRIDEAFDLSKAYIEKHQSEIGAQENLVLMCDNAATYLINSGKSKEAIPYAKRVLTLSDSVNGLRLKNQAINSTRLYYMACKLAGANLTDAEAEIKKTISLVLAVKGEHASERLIMLGRTLGDMGRFDYALEILSKARAAVVDAPPKNKKKLLRECAEAEQSVEARRMAGRPVRKPGQLP